MIAPVATMGWKTLTCWKTWIKICRGYGREGAINPHKEQLRRFKERRADPLYGVLSWNRRNFRPFVPKIPASRQQSYRALTTRLNPTGVDLSTNP